MDKFCKRLSFRGNLGRIKKNKQKSPTTQWPGFYQICCNLVFRESQFFHGTNQIPTRRCRIGFLVDLEDGAV